MHRHRLALAGTLIAVAVTAAPAAAAAPSGVIARDAALGPVAATADTVAWSAWDPTVRKFRLIVRGQDGVTAPLPVRPQSSPFDVSAGRGPDGHTWLVWARCTNATPGATQNNPRGCHVVRWNTADPGERLIPLAGKPGRSAYAASIDGDRLVFADAPSTRHPARARVLLATLSSGSVRALPAIPPTSCSLSIEAECVPTTFARVWSTAIHGTAVAVGASVATASEGVGLCGLGVLRLIDLPTGTARTLSHTICGLSGSLFAATAFDAAGNLWWARTCGGDDGACGHGKGGPFRLDVTAMTVARLTGVGGGLTGFAVAGATPVLGNRATYQPSCFAQADGTAQGNEVYTCGTIAAVAAPVLEPAALTPARDPDDGSLPARTSTRLQVLRPPSRLTCGAPGDAAVWAGAFTPPVKIDARHQRFVATSRIAVVATSHGRPPVRATVPGTRYYWKYTRLDLGRHACGRTWTLSYAATRTTPAASFRVRVG